MAREAVLEINCGRYTKRLVNIIQLLNKLGWKYIDKNKNVEYLPLGDNGDYDWQKKVLSEFEIQELINSKQDKLEKVGINLYYQNSNEGVTLLANDTSEILFDLDINRRTLESNRESITDVGWYIEHIIQALIQENCPVDYFKFEEYVG